MFPMTARRRADRKNHFGRIFYNMARMSGLGIPQISVVHGISVAGGAYVVAESWIELIVQLHACHVRYRHHRQGQ
jgi:acetyl-CoA carboxylase carboxyltransferase component